MKVVFHADPLTLERELLARVGQSSPAGTLRRVLVLVPSDRLVDHVQRRLTEQRPAWLGVEVVQFGALARRILAGASAPPLRTASPRLLEALLRRVLQGARDNRWSSFVERRPGALARLLRALTELREAGIEAPLVEDVARERGTPRVRDLARLYRAWVAELRGGQSRGFVDGAGLARAALPHAARFGRRLDAVFVHGAYELIGIHLELLRELDRVVGVTVLVPAHPGAAATAFAESFAREHLLGSAEPEVAADRAAPERRERLTALFDEGRSPAGAGAEFFVFRHAQGAEPEVRVAVRQALADVEAGCPPAEIAIVARSLEPYAAAIEEVFATERLPWTSSLGGPLRRQPVIHDLLLLLRVVAEDFPRAATAELLRSPRLSWPRLLGAGSRPPSGDRAEAWSRAAGIVGGLEEWTTGLSRWAARPGRDDEEPEAARERAARRRDEAARIAAALEALRRAVVTDSRRFSEHAAGLEALLDIAFDGTGEEAEQGRPAREALGLLFSEMRALDTLAGDERGVGFAEMRAWLENAVDGSELPLQPLDGGGIRVLDAMQMRGMTFRRVHLLGANSRLLPRVAREDPVLDDELRAELARRSGRPVTLKSRSSREERLLLALVLGAATERLEVSWQRADESGRAKTPSLALREIARACYGRPEFERLTRSDAVHVPSHPTQWLEHVLGRPGMLAPRERVLLAALHSQGAEALDRLGRRFEPLAPGLAMLRATQDFDGSNGGYDARIGASGGPLALSVSAFETLGRCPLRYFFRHVLRVRALEEAASAFELSPLDLGKRIHEALEAIYRELMRSGAFATDDVEALSSRALALLEARREELLGENGPRLVRRLPVLWDQTVEKWLLALRDFLEWDLRRLSEAGLRPEALEVDAARTLDLGAGGSLALRGRFDRIAVGPSGRMVSDYKTGGDLERRVRVLGMVRAQELQVPAYHLLAGRDTPVELLGVGPNFTDDEERRKVFSGFDPRQVASFGETLGTLIGLLQEGVFPLRPDAVRCSWCEYRQACRRNHPPTTEREARSADSEAFRRLEKKGEKDRDGD